jgi:hypothetical protein
MVGKSVLVTLMVIGLMAISFGACRSSNVISNRPSDVISNRPSYVDQVISEQDFNTYMGRIEIIASGENPVPLLLDMYLPKVKKYCEANKLSMDDCDQLESDLMKKLQFYLEQRNERRGLGIKQLEKMMKEQH